MSKYPDETSQEAARNSGLAAAQGGLMGLHMALKARLAAVVAGFTQFETKDETVQRAPTVLESLLPPKKDSDVENFPFLLVRHKSGIDTVQGGDQNATAVVEIAIGTYSDTDQGYFDLLTVIDAIRADLGAKPGIDRTAYEHIGPLTWETPAQQARPQWLASINTIWQLPRPVRRDAVEG